MPVWVQYAAEHFISFSVGILIGFFLSNKFKIVKRNGNGHKEEEGS